MNSNQSVAVQNIPFNYSILYMYVCSICSQQYILAWEARSYSWLKGCKEQLWMYECTYIMFELPFYISELENKNKY